jgi:hypothetical protein
MNYGAYVETVKNDDMVWYEGVLMTREEAKEMREGK